MKPERSGARDGDSEQSTMEEDVELTEDEKVGQSNQRAHQKQICQGGKNRCWPFCIVGINYFEFRNRI